MCLVRRCRLVFGRVILVTRSLARTCTIRGQCDCAFASLVRGDNALMLSLPCV